MDNFSLHSYFKKQYLNESLEVNLKDLTFDMLINTYPENYKTIHFSRMQPNGEKGNYYRDSISLPSWDDSSTAIGDMSALENYKKEIISRFGNVKISLKPESENWFDKAEILDDKFQNTKDKIGKGKAAAMEKDTERGWSID
tara:strand:- start:186 stop:611 length:426 start_codon:yes stop_codon:yes gene_type:complete